MDRGQPLLTISPPDDETFRMWATVLARSTNSPEELQDALRARAYRAAVVRQRGLADEIRPTWYVYRDGHWVAPGSTTVAIGGASAPGVHLMEYIAASREEAVASLQRTADALHRIIDHSSRLTERPRYRDAAERRIIEGEESLAEIEAAIARLDQDRV